MVDRRKVIVVALGGCVAVPVGKVYAVQGAGNLESLKGTMICVPSPPDASFAGEIYAGSGNEVALKTVRAITDKGSTATSVGGTAPDFLARCKEKGATVILQPIILHYENHVTGWSGVPDRIKVRLVLFSMAAPETKKTVVYEAKSNAVVSGLFEWGNAHPSELLSGEFTDAVRVDFIGATVKKDGRCHNESESNEPHPSWPSLTVSFRNRRERMRG